VGKFGPAATLLQLSLGITSVTDRVAIFDGIVDQIIT